MERDMRDVRFCESFLGPKLGDLAAAFERCLTQKMPKSVTCAVTRDSSARGRDVSSASMQAIMPQSLQSLQ
jgi:hypothetical protein